VCAGKEQWEWNVQRSLGNVFGIGDSVCESAIKVHGGGVQRL